MSEQADRDLLEAQRILADAWSTRGFHIPHFFGLFCRGQVAIYSGNRSAAMDLLTRELPAMRRSYLLRVETIAILALLLEGTLAIACAAGPVAPGRTLPISFAGPAAAPKPFDESRPSGDAVSP